MSKYFTEVRIRVPVKYFEADYTIEAVKIDDRLHALSQKHLREVTMTIVKKIITVILWITDLDL